LNLKSHWILATYNAKEELRAELTSVFLMAERGIPHNPDSHAACLGSWLKALRDDKHEIFHAARDANKAANLLMALALHKSLDQALAHVNKPQLETGSGRETVVIPFVNKRENPAVEMEF
jgi:antirestriction protein ArdC